MSTWTGVARTIGAMIALMAVVPMVRTLMAAAPAVVGRALPMPALEPPGMPVTNPARAHVAVTGAMSHPVATNPGKAMPAPAPVAGSPDEADTHAGNRFEYRQRWHHADAYADVAIRLRLGAWNVGYRGQTKAQTKTRKYLAVCVHVVSVV